MYEDYNPLHFQCKEVARVENRRLLVEPYWVIDVGVRKVEET